VDSLCQISANFASVPSDASVAFLQNGFALATRFLYVEAFRAEFKGMETGVLLRSFSPAPNAAPIFRAGGPLAIESVSFFYVALICRPELATAIGAGKYSNSFVYHLILNAELLFEKGGFSYGHSVLLSVILLIVADHDAAVALNCPRSDIPNCRLPLPLGSYADLLLGVLLNICKDDALWPSLACIFHVIAPSLSIVSASVAGQITELFEQAVDRRPAIVSLLLEGFASIVQTNQSDSNGFPVALFPKYSQFKKLVASSKNRSGKALALILLFLAAERKAAQATKQKSMSADRLSQIFAAIDADALFPEKQSFVRQPHTVGSELEQAWPEWADFHFARAFEPELAQLRAYRAD
jgi:hypothetical protein